MQQSVDGGGKITKLDELTSIAETNPFRYRGYYYDNESNHYYLNSRYYYQVIKRFINADDISLVTASPNALTDKNLFAYCDNNPVVRRDVDGDIWHIAVGAAVGGLISGFVTIASNAISGENLTDGLLLNVLAGATSGALSSTGIGIVGAIIGNAAISGIQETASQLIENKGFSNLNVKNIAKETVIGGIAGAIGGKGSGTKHMTNLGKQTIKRTTNAVKHSGIKAGVKEASKSFVYYIKNTRGNYRKIYSAKNILSNFATEIFL